MTQWELTDSKKREALRQILWVVLALSNDSIEGLIPVLEGC